MATTKKTTYEELTSAKVSNNRTIVISSCSKGGYTLAQKMRLKDDEGKEMNIFLKGAFTVEDVNGLYELRDAINGAIAIEEEKTANDWDATEQVKKTLKKFKNLFTNSKKCDIITT